MCRSKAEGGRRCTGHQKQAIQRATEKIERLNRRIEALKEAKGLPPRARQEKLGLLTPPSPSRIDRDLTRANSLIVMGIENIKQMTRALAESMALTHPQSNILGKLIEKLDARPARYDFLTDEENPVLYWRVPNEKVAEVAGKPSVGGKWFIADNFEAGGVMLSTDASQGELDEVNPHFTALQDELEDSVAAEEQDIIRRQWDEAALREAIEEAFVEAPKYAERKKELRRLSDRTRGALDSEAERKVVERIASDSFNALYDAYEVGIFNVGVENLPELAAAKYRKFTGMRPIGDDFEDFKEGYIAQFWKDCEKFLPRHLDGLRKYHEGIARMESIYADATKVSA